MADKKTYYYLKLKEGFFDSEDMLLLQGMKDGYIYSDILLKTSMDVLGLMKTSSYKFKQTLVMITHNDEIAQLADRIIHIEDGKIVQ